jgi:uncharacterized protein (TIGR03435 family)
MAQLVLRVLDSRRISLLLTAACLALAAPLASAQTNAAPLASAQTNAAPAPPATADSADSAAKPMTYDAISIKLNNGGTSVNNQGMIRSMVMMRNLPDGFSAANANVRQLIANAYDVKDDQVSGGPDWVGSTGYDIEAKVTDPDGPHQLTKAQRTQALQALLADRFKIAVHAETKDAPIYALTIAKGGPKLKESKPSDALPAGIPPGAAVRGPDGAVPRGSMMRMSGPGNLTAPAMTTTQLATMLSQQLHMTVVDRTGLTGSYDFSLQWTPDNLPPPPPGAEASAPGGPSIFTAVQEQLGLKLDSTRGPVKTLVIDHIERPSEN